jgi:DNA-binding MarR family transcriptional regulator
MDGDDLLAERLRESVGRFVRATRAKADTLAPPHAATLGHLDRDGALSIAQLARLRGVRHQSMSTTVRELEAAGHVVRRPNPDDARGFVITITERGRAALDGERRARGLWVARAIATLADDERGLLEGVPAVLDRLSRFAGPPG